MCNANIAKKQTELHRRVRAGLVASGSSLNAWCNANGIKRQNADRALLGDWTGPKASELVQRLVKAAGVNS